MTARTANPHRNGDSHPPDDATGEGDRSAAPSRAPPPARGIGDGGEEESPADRAPGASDAPTVLFVDDESALVAVYEQWLAETCTVRTATSGSEALDRLEGVDVVFLDRKMPGRSGEDLLGTLRERAPDCRVAFLSALKPDDAVEGLAYDEYLEKPLSEEELRAAVDRLLDG